MDRPVRTILARPDAGEVQVKHWRALAIGAALSFGITAACVATGVTDRFDDAAMLALRHYDPSAWALNVVIAVTYLGASGLRIPIALASIGLLCAARRFRAAIFVGIAVGGGLLLNGLLKLIFARPRPDLTPHLQEVTSTGFPSGHALGATVTYGALAIVIGCLDARYRGGAIAAALVLVTVIGLTRIYLGVHMPTDVIAGVSAGLAWLALCSRLVQRKYP